MITALLLAGTLLAQGERVQSVELNIEGTTRQFLVYTPLTRDARPRPVVFAFHGHGGNMRYALRKFKFDRTWPEAISVYMQGLPTPGRTDHEGKKNGWQNRVGTLGDRDIKFFDGVLAWIKARNRVDEKSIFSMGHSNGGGFTMALWNSHPSLFKGLGVCAAGGRAQLTNEPTAYFATSGRNDPVVPFRGQQASVDQVKRVNKISRDGTPWGPNATRWEGAAPLVWHVTDGGHELSDEALALLTRFFKELAK